MIEITPILTPPIPKIKKVIRDGQKPDNQKQSESAPKDKESKDDDPGEQVQHIDEVV